MNDIKLGDSHPLTEELKPLKVGGDSSALEVAKSGKGCRVRGDLEVTGNMPTDNTKLSVSGGAMTGDIDLYDGFTFDGNDINIDSSTGNVKIVTGGLTSILLDCGASPAVKIFESPDGADYSQIRTSTHGVTFIETVDDAADGADLYIDIDGDISVDSATGKFSIKNNGTEFSVAGSSFAGTILGYTTVGIDATAASYTLTTSFAVATSAHKVKFVAPPSGVVEIFVSIFADSSRRFIHFGLSDNATYNAVDVTHEHEVLVPGGTSDEAQMNHYWVITGLTPGTAYEYWLGSKITSGSGGVLRWGGDATGEWPPFIMKATALPIAVADYAVYG